MPETPVIQVQIRAAHRDDVPAIVRLLADDFLGAAREQASDPLPQRYWEAYDAMAAQGGNELFVAELDGEIVGCLQLTTISGLSRMGLKRGLIEGVRVSAARRGHRIGEALMRAAIDRAKQLGCGVVQLTTDARRTDAHRFYERLGFEATHVGMKLTVE
jgi:ribosomal protein S18 acetylase RimI-like enzyme